MTTLRFKAREGHLVPVPGTEGVGVPRYVGKKYDYDKREYVDAPFECDADSPVAARLMRELQRHDSLTVETVQQPAKAKKDNS